MTIQLFNASNAQLVAQTQTDVNGHYVISNIPAGSYYLHEIQPAGPLDLIREALEQTLFTKIARQISAHNALNSGPIHLLVSADTSAPTHSLKPGPHLIQPEPSTLK